MKLKAQMEEMYEIASLASCRASKKDKEEERIYYQGMMAGLRWALGNRNSNTAPDNFEMLMKELEQLKED